MSRRQLALLAVLAVCLAAPARATEVPTPTGQAGQLLNVSVHTLIDLRFKNVVRQAYDVSCGAAALATLLKYYYGQDTTEQDLINSMLALGDAEKIKKDGFSMLELKRQGEKLGYVVGGFRLADVDKLAYLKVPAITLIKTRGYNHFVVLKGVAQGTVFIADPAFGNRSMSLDQFGSVWDRVILVFVSPTRTGSNNFAYDGTVRAPVGDVKLLISTYPLLLQPGAGEMVRGRLGEIGKF